MKKIIKQSIIYYIALVTGLVLVSGCSMEQNEIQQNGTQQNDTGSLSLKITANDTNISSYNIKLDGPENEIINTNTGVNEVKTIDDLTVGSWSIIVNAINTNNESVGSKKTTINITQSQVASCEIIVITGTVMKGWELDETNTGLAGVGLTENDLTIFDPNGVDTGKGEWIGSTGYKLLIYGNQTIERKKLVCTSGYVTLEDNVTLKECLIKPTGAAEGMSLLNTGAGCIIQDCDIDGSLLPDNNCAHNGIGTNSSTIIRCNIHHIDCGIMMGATNGSMRVQNNYIHDIRYEPNSGDHLAGMSLWSGSEGISIIGNRVNVGDHPGDTTAALFSQPLYSHINNVIIENNIFVSCGYVVRLENVNYGCGTNFQVFGNRLVVLPGGYEPFLSLYFTPSIFSLNYSYISESNALNNINSTLLL